MQQSMTRTESVCETKDDGTSQTERETKRREFNDALRAETRGLSWWEQLDDELTKNAECKLKQGDGKK